VNLLGALRRAWRESPEATVRRVARRVAPSSPVAADPPPWRHGKHQKWNRLPYYLDLLRELAARQRHPVDLLGRHVLEIGGGPVLGLGPFVLTEGARAFTLVEPGWREVRGEDDFRRSYLTELYQTHAPLFAAPGMSQARFLDAIDAVTVVPAGMETYAGADPVDLFVSKSCLEHIPDLDGALAACARAAAPGALHLHYVDFSLHRADGFGDLYQSARASHPEGLGQPGGHLNLLRPSEVLARFRAHFDDAVLVPLIRAPLHDSARHADWQAFDPDDLSIASALVYARSPGR
jgi:hypothetical protein